MHFETTHNYPDARFLSEQRKIVRQRDFHLLAITNKGTGQIIDISQDGLSFGCLYPHTLPEEFSLDLLDAKGTLIKSINVRKIWERRGMDLSHGSYELEVGVEFTELTSLQYDELDELLHSTDDMLVYSVL